MAARATPTISTRDFYNVMVKLRDLRAWAVKRNVDPWAFRQALITVLELDTLTALERGVPRENLEKFDVGGREEAQKFVRGLP